MAIEYAKQLTDSALCRLESLGFHVEQIGISGTSPLFHVAGHVGGAVEMLDLELCLFVSQIEQQLEVLACGGF